MLEYGTVCSSINIPLIIVFQWAYHALGMETVTNENSDMRVVASIYRWGLQPAARQFLLRDPRQHTKLYNNLGCHYTTCDGTRAAIEWHHSMFVAVCRIRFDTCDLMKWRAGYVRLTVRCVCRMKNGCFRYFLTLSEFPDSISLTGRELSG